MHSERFLSLILFLIFALFFTKTVNASMQMTTNCPDVFVGEVSRFVEPQAPIHSLSKRSVYFKTSEGERMVKMLEFGPIKVHEGKKYWVELRKGHICKIEEVL